MSLVIDRDPRNGIPKPSENSNDNMFLLGGTQAGIGRPLVLKLQRKGYVAMSFCEPRS